MNKIHLRIGGAKDNQLVIESVDIAPYHLELFCDTSGNVFITDLNSEQGTFVNKRRLNGFQLLKKGDHVRFGQNYNFPWEDFIPVQSNKNKEVRNEVKEVSEPVNVRPKKQAKAANSTSVNNMQLYVIYACIIFLVILLSLYL